MKILKQIILLSLLSLVVVDASSAALPTDESNTNNSDDCSSCTCNAAAELELLSMPQAGIDQILSSGLLNGLDVNDYDDLYEAVKRLCKLKQVCKNFKDQLTPKKMANILLSMGLDVMTIGDYVPWFAGQDIAVVAKILMEAIPVEQRAAFVMSEVNGCHKCTVLQYAVIFNSVGVIRALLDSLPEEQAIAVITVVDKFGWTELESAVHNRQLNNANLFLEYYNRFGIEISQDLLQEIQELRMQATRQPK